MFHWGGKLKHGFYFLPVAASSSVNVLWKLFSSEAGETCAVAKALVGFERTRVQTPAPTSMTFWPLCAPVHDNTHSHTHTHTCTQTHMYTDTHVYTQTHTYTCTHVHTQSHTHVHRHIHTYVHIHTCIHTYTLNVLKVRLFLFFNHIDTPHPGNLKLIFLPSVQIVQPHIVFGVVLGEQEGNSLGM